MLSLQNNQEQLKHDQVMSLVFLVVLVPLSYAAFTIYHHLICGGTQSGSIRSKLF
jgi:cytochrome c oxidase assembly protein Cox11